jgi:hypothetical protein
LIQQEEKIKNKVKHRSSTLETGRCAGRSDLNTLDAGSKYRKKDITMKKTTCCKPIPSKCLNCIFFGRENAFTSSKNAEDTDKEKYKKNPI